MSRHSTSPVIGGLSGTRVVENRDMESMYTISHFAGWDLGLDVGDIVRMYGDSNRIRRRVTALTADGYRIESRFRPSKGWRHHVRRIKAAQPTILTRARK